MIYKINHVSPKNVYADFIMLPLGIRMNRELLSYKKGDRIKMLDGNTYLILGVGTIQFNSTLASALCFLRYGITLKRLLMLWGQNAIAYGYGKKAVNQEECLIVVYGSKDCTETNNSNWNHSDYPL